MKKTTSENLSKRLTEYGALAAAMASIASVNGQIIYHPNVDISGPSDTFINLNPVDGITPSGIADGIDDFRIFITNTSVPSSAAIQIEAMNGEMIASSSIFVYPFALNSGDIISSANSNWNNASFGSLVVYDNCQYGNWCTANDKFLGLRFTINGSDIHYGWAKLDVDAATLSWTLKEFAFNSTPNELIKAGQTVLGLDNNQFSTIKIVALNKSIALSNLPQHTDYKVFNMSGQTVMDGKIMSQSHVIEANTLANGIYIIELQASDTKALIRKKIVL